MWSGGDGAVGAGGGEACESGDDCAPIIVEEPDVVVCSITSAMGGEDGTSWRRCALPALFVFCLLAHKY